MPERVTLTAPVTKPARTSIEIERLTIDVKAKLVFIQWLADNGDAGSAAYPTPAPVDAQGNPTQPTGAVLINALNNANLSTKSLVKRIYERLQTDGHLAAGAIAGTPD